MYHCVVPQFKAFNWSVMHHISNKATQDEKKRCQRLELRLLKLLVREINFLGKG